MVIGWWEKYEDGYGASMRSLRGTGIARGCLVHDLVRVDRMQVILLEGFDR